METYTGHVRTPADAILLFEACRIGLLPRVQRRLSEKERQQIKSGSVFVWDEREAGMRRWTDGKSWSASRVSGSFLTYREMEGKRGGSFPTPTPAPKRPSGKSPDGSVTGESDGEGPDGYRYKPDGLMKQSFSITTSSGQHLHLISYFSRSHPTATDLRQPTTDPQLRHIRPPKNMYPESTVNETTNIPAVTRSPMPGSPFAPAHQQMGSQSPYSRPGHSPQVPVLVGYHGPPTPPYQHPQYYSPHPQAGFPPGPVYFMPHGFPPHPQAMTRFDALPPALSNTQPPHGHPGYPPQHYYPAPQYAPNPPVRVMEAAQLAQQQAQAHAHAHAHAHAQRHQSQQVPPPPPRDPAINPNLPEPGPQLPALNGIRRPSSPQPTENQTSDSLAAPDANAAVPSPTSRTIPNIKTLLNNHAVDENVDAGKSGNSRSGSRSPSNAQRPPREMVAVINSSAADTSSIHKLNSAFGK